MRGRSRCAKLGAMSRAYGSGLEHLDDVIGIVGTLFERQLVAAQGHGLLGRSLDARTGSCVRAGGAGLDHRDEVMWIVGTLCERQLVAAQGHGLLGRSLDARTGSFVSSAEVASILRAAPLPADARARVDALDAALDARIDDMEARL